MRPPRYFGQESELAGAKTWACPHCHGIGQLNRHGALRGLGADGTSKAARRGQRFFCSNRGRRRGCGRTCSVLFATALKFATVRTGVLGRFYQALWRGQSVSAAWERSRSGFSLEAAYGWWRRWRRAEPVVRTRLAQGRDPPAAHLAAALTAAYGADDPLAQFQLRHQAAWP